MGPVKYPDWVIEARKIYEPHLIGCHLADNAPEEAKEAMKKVGEYILQFAQ